MRYKFIYSVSISFKTANSKVTFKRSKKIKELVTRKITILY